MSNVQEGERVITLVVDLNFLGLIKVELNTNPHITSNDISTIMCVTVQYSNSYNTHTRQIINSSIASTEEISM